MVVQRCWRNAARTSCKFPTPHHGCWIGLLETNAAGSVVASLANHLSNNATLQNEVTLSTSRSPSCDASEAGSADVTFDEEDITGDATKDNPSPTALI